MTMLCKLKEGQKIWPPPIWLMRQAGRYLSEYNGVRNKAGSFLELCYNPELASEVTLQPIERFDFDAAIIFADILLIVENLGFDLDFIDQEGPVISGIGDAYNSSGDTKISVGSSRLMKVGEAINLTRNKLDKTKSLIGFCGAPWTVLTYIINGRSTKDFQETLAWAINNHALTNEIIENITDLSIEYLSMQIEAGADVVKIFDSWAGVLPNELFLEWVIKPTCKIISEIKLKHPSCPVIGFPRGAGELYLEYVDKTGVDIIALDSNLSRVFCRDKLQEKVILQGNVCPDLLRKGGKVLQNDIQENLQMFGGKPFIFNLGHGVKKDTPIENIHDLVRIVRDYK